MLSEDFRQALTECIPESQILSSRAELAPYESDGLTAFRAAPAVVVLPECQQEVIDVVRLCSRHEVPFVARGSGTSLSGGSVPVEAGVVIAMNRLKRIVRYCPDQQIVVVEPGVINQDVSKLTAQEGLYYAPDPSSGPICTIGGNVAFNSGGAHCLKYGMTSNHVLGLKVVLPDGEVCELGGDSLEPSGEDLTGMFVGSEGLFGVALEVTLRLLAKPECFFTLQSAYRSLEEAGNAVSQIVASGLLPGAMEIMDRLAMDAADAAVQAGYPKDAEAILIVELEGPVEEVEAERPKLLALIESSGAYLTEPAADAAQRARIWAGRKSAFSAVGRLSPDFIVQDGVVPRGRLGEALAKIDALSRQYDIRVANVFHAGDGNLHPLIMFDGSVDGALHKAEALAGDILRMCVALGGSITGEHGVGLEKRAYLEDMYGEEDVEFLSRLRDAVDPLQLANRGKMLPEKLAPSLIGHDVHPLEKQGVITRD